MEFKRNHRLHLFLILIAALFFVAFANGNAVPAAAWLGPVFLIRYIRDADSKLEWAAALAGICIAQAISLYGPLSNANIPPAARAGLGCLYGLVLYLPPFIIDRWLHGRLNGLAGTLAFPAAFVAVEYLNSLVSPFSTFGLIAYTQYGSLPLMQIVSITGIWGLAFIVTWGASVINLAWECRESRENAAPSLALYAIVLVSVLVYGGLRVRNAFGGGTVRIAVSSLSYDLRPVFAGALRHGTAPDAAANMRAFDSFLDGVPRSGVRIAVWQEYALIVRERDAPAVLAHAAGRVKARGIYCTLPMGIATAREGRFRLMNMAYLIGPGGEIISEYVKTFTAPWETSTNSRREIALADTGIARLAMTICFDMDFPFLVRQAGRAGADIMLVPSFDWRGLVPFHSRMAVFRAIENGFSLVRSAGSDGASIATDPYGRVLGYLDNASSADRLMVVDVPVRGVRTVYSIIGDLYAWLCVAAVLFLVAAALRRKRSTP